MNHVPTPQFPRYPPPDIPCLVRQEFSYSSSQSFDKYPESRGWKLKGIIDGDFSQNHTRQECQSFFQEWLYFGLMAQVFGSVGIEIDMDDFTRRRDGEIVIDSTNLIRYISEFERQFRELETQVQLTSVTTVDRALTATQRLVVRECSMTTPLDLRSESWPFDSTTSLSFMILGCTLAFAVSRVIQVLPDKTHALEIYKKLHVSHNYWGTSELLYQRMRSDNWCPHRLAQLASGEFSVIGMYYASLTEVPWDGKEHTSCDVRQCLFMTVDEKTYQTKHTHSPPDCQTHIPDRKAIIQSLKVNSIPLIRIRVLATNDIAIDIVPYRAGIKYVALSHVWAHGLGNVKGNWLPDCQMRRLHKLVLALHPFSGDKRDLLLWIDTICVPRKLEGDDKDYRKVAIDLLQDTYRNADKVLVLDEQLERSSSRATPEELLIRIISSGWVTRLWTLQEALLSGKLRFQFRERALDAEDMLSDIMPIHHSSVWYETYEFFSSLRVLKEAPARRKLRQLWNYLQWRSTSHASDETICLSILTGKQPSKVHGLPHADRMRAFLEQMDGIPSDIIFMPGPRLSEDGWKWAPTSFMARHQWTAYEHFQKTVIPGAAEHTLSLQTNISQNFNKGLRVHFPGLILTEVPENLDMVFKVEETHMKTKMQFVVVHQYDRCPPEWKDIDIKSLQHPMIVLNAYPEAYGATRAILVDAYEGPGLEGSIAVDPTAKVVTPVRFVCRASVNVLDTESTNPESQKTKQYFQGDAEVSRYCKGRLLDSQWWYIG